MDKDRKVVVKIVDDLLDNSKSCDKWDAYDELEAYVERARIEALGWMYIASGVMADPSKDLHKATPTDLLAQAQADLTK